MKNKFWSYADVYFVEEFIWKNFKSHNPTPNHIQLWPQIQTYSVLTGERQKVQAWKIYKLPGFESCFACYVKGRHH